MSVQKRCKSRIEKIEEVDYEYHYSLRRKASDRRRGKSYTPTDVSELINIERQWWQNHSKHVEPTFS